MGKHQKDAGRSVIEFLATLGKILGYLVQQEEYMFPGKKNSPILDIAWHNNTGHGQPLFIFEIESQPTKSAPDNVLKVFSRNTSDYKKPLFFYHVFVRYEQDTDRVKSLSEAYGKTNYGVFPFDTDKHQLILLREILEQHLRISTDLDIFNIACLITESPNLSVTSEQFLNEVVEMHLDLASKTNLIATAEELLLNCSDTLIKNFYRGYLRRYLTSKEIPIPQYASPLFIAQYHKIIHFALAGLILNDIVLDALFQTVVNTEKRWQPFPLWEPYFSLSYDHDMLLIVEFPLLLTLLCLVFAPINQGIYFSKKLARILSSVKIIDSLSRCSFIWLLLASKIAGDKDSYDYAKTRLNAEGGVSLTSINQPYHLITSDNMCQPEMLVPEYERWSEWIGLKDKPNESIDIEKFVIGSFLFSEDYIKYRTYFAQYCIWTSLKAN